jgi:hypothetical protein
VGDTSTLALKKLLIKSHGACPDYHIFLVVTHFYPSYKKRKKYKEKNSWKKNKKIVVVKRGCRTA